MSSGQPSSRLPHMSAPLAAARESSQVGRESTHASADEWADVQDPNERRRIQNRLAQRRFREKAREQREDAEREAENLLRAGSAYASPEPGDLDPGHELEGLPWGGPSLRHIVESGKSKEQASQRSSREPSVLAAAAAAAAASQAGWSARVGLRLTHNFAWGNPARTSFPARRPAPGWG